jgi:hypothetical protein
MLSIITPCTRQENLPKIFNSIHFDLIDKWYIIYDTSNKKNKYVHRYLSNPKIVESFCPASGKYGNAQRNVAIHFVKDGFVYYLDDDNIIHPELWNTLPYLDPTKFYSWNQQRNQHGLEYKSDKFQVTNIDTAQFIAPRNLLEDIFWETQAYDADTIFFRELYSKYPEKYCYIDKVVCYYNYLTWP